MFLSRLKAIDGVDPDMVVLDYIDEYKPYCDDLYVNGGRQFAETRQMAADFNTLVWTASQVSRSTLTKSGRDGFFKGPIKMENISNSAQKTFKADGLLSINDIYNDGVLSLRKKYIYVDGLRRGKDGFKIFVDTDFEVSLIKQSTDQREKSSDEGGDPITQSGKQKFDTDTFIASSQGVKLSEPDIVVPQESAEDIFAGDL